MKPDKKQGKTKVYIIITTVIFVLLITALAWQSDDAYHAYVMARHLVEGNGFVYNIGERASASSCPLFTLVIACGYFLFRNMFVVSLLICIVFSTIAYIVLVRDFCRGRIQITAAFLTLVASAASVLFIMRYDPLKILSNRD